MAFTLTYKDNIENVEISSQIQINDDAALRKAFAGFVELTRIAEYQDASWKEIIVEALNFCEYSDQGIFEWANSTLAGIL